MVQSSDYDDNWSKPVSISFQIKAPIYKQIWFYILSLLTFSLIIYIIILLRTNYFKKVNVLLKESYVDRSKLLSNAYSNIESNIKYAKNIQNAVLRTEEDLLKIFHNSFVFSKPKESIGGDFFWYSRKSRNFFVVVADCVGHGVPGAFMSLIGHNLLNQTINEIDSFDPPYILEEVSKNFAKAIRNTELDVEQNNDMDIAFCRIDKDRKELVFSGANSTAYFIHENKLTELKGNKRAIGQDNEIITQFSRTKLKYEQGDLLYLFTNGFADQFGGPDNKRYKTTRLKNLIINIHELSIDEQKVRIIEAFESWKGKAEQIDDVLLLGIRL
jgi:serine phosphatase RsbU (regulator of sigma subunit)